MMVPLTKLTLADIDVKIELPVEPHTIFFASYYVSFADSGSFLQLVQ